MPGLVINWPWATHDLDGHDFLTHLSLNLALGPVCHLFSSPDSIPKEVTHWQRQISPIVPNRTIHYHFMESPNHISRRTNLPAYWFLLALTLFSHRHLL